jgi:CPA2 family monovalent cation:H+ antiporter-2
MELEFLKALVLVFGVSALSVFVLHRLKIPPIVGFILAGLLIGPNGFGVIRDVREVEILAEIGIILLLFTVGVEFSLRNLLRIRKAVVFGGGGQVVLTISVFTLIAYAVIGNPQASVFLGFLAALSSTAIVLKILLERGETDSPQGRLMVGVLIFQDLCVVPLMLLIPALSGGRLDVFELGWTFLKALAIIAVVLLSAKWIVPRVLHQVVHTRSRELFLITVIFLCLGIALLTSQFGLSLALGAFLAGLVISESEYSYQATAEILPFKDSFMGLFFVSIGMLIDIAYISANWHLVLATVIGIFLVKSTTATVSLLTTSASLRVSTHAGIGLAQIGEFSFILAAAGRAAGLLSGEIYQLFLSATVITMSFTPFVLKAASPASIWLTTRGPLKKFRGKPGEVPFSRINLDHVIITGFGLNGRNLARTLRQTGVPYVVLELNSDTVRAEKKKGEPIFYGDGTSVEVLHRLGIKTAKVLVVAISDPSATRKIVALARKENPSIHIIVRTRYLVEVEDLRALGADEVIPEEFETSVEIFSRVLHHYNVPRNVITDHIEEIRKNGYQALRSHKLPAKSFEEMRDRMSEIETEAYLVKIQSHIPGHTLRELHLRARTGATVIAIERDGKFHPNPSADTVIKENDVIVLLGRREDMNKAVEYMESDAFLTEKY